MNTSFRLRSFDSWGTNTSLRLLSFDSWGTNTLVCLRSFDSLGTNKFIILCPFDSLRDEYIHFDPKKLSSSSFFMLWRRGIDYKELIPLANVPWARIWKRLRSPGIDFKEPIPLANVAWARICKSLRSSGIDSASLCNLQAGTTSRVVVPARQAGNWFRAP